MIILQALTTSKFLRKIPNSVEDINFGAAELANSWTNPYETVMLAAFSRVSIQLFEALAWIVLNTEFHLGVPLNPCSFFGCNLCVYYLWTVLFN